MSRNKKKIRLSVEPNQGKRIAPHHARESSSTNHERPTFNLEHLGGDYCLSKCETLEKAAFADTLHKLSKMTWGEIQLAPRHGNGIEIIPRAAFGARQLPPEVTEDVNLIAFRFWGKAPMVGYRTGRLFTVLFLDRDFTLYDHE